MFGLLEDEQWYWPVILMSAVLGVIAGALIVAFTFYLSVVDCIPVFACIKAIGGTTVEVAGMLAVQVALVVCAGSVLAAVGLWIAHEVLRDSSISILITPELVGIGIGVMGASAAFASAWPMVVLLRVDPGEAFCG